MTYTENFIKEPGTVAPPEQKSASAIQGNYDKMQELAQGLEQIWKSARLVYDGHHKMESVFKHIFTYKKQTAGVWKRLLRQPLSYAQFLAFVDVVIHPLHNNDRQEVMQELMQEAPNTMDLITHIDGYRRRYEAIKRLDNWRDQVRVWIKDKQYEHGLAYFESLVLQFPTLIGTEADSDGGRFAESIKAVLQHINANGLRYIENIQTFTKSYQLKANNISVFGKYLGQALKVIHERHYLTDKELGTVDPLHQAYLNESNLYTYLTTEDHKAVARSQPSPPEELSPAIALQHLMELHHDVDERLTNEKDKGQRRTLAKLKDSLPGKDWQMMLQTNEQVLIILGQALNAAKSSLGEEEARWGTFEEFYQGKKILALKHLDRRALDSFVKEISEVKKAEELDRKGNYPQEWRDAAIKVINERNPRMITLKTYEKIHQTLYRYRLESVIDCKKIKISIEEAFAKFTGKKGSRAKALIQIASIIEDEVKNRERLVANDLKPRYRAAKHEIDSRVDLLIAIRKKLLQLRYKNMEWAPALREYLDLTELLDPHEIREDYVERLTSAIKSIKLAREEGNQGKQLICRDLKANLGKASNSFSRSSALLSIYLNNREFTDQYDEMLKEVDQDTKMMRQLDEGIKYTNHIDENYRRIAHAMELILKRPTFHQLEELESGLDNTLKIHPLKQEMRQSTIQ